MNRTFRTVIEDGTLLRTFDVDITWRRVRENCRWVVEFVGLEVKYAWGGWPGHSAMRPRPGFLTFVIRPGDIDPVYLYSYYLAEITEAICNEADRIAEPEVELTSSGEVR